MQLLFGFLLLFYVPNLDPYPGYTPIEREVSADGTEYEPLPGDEQICPERHVNIFSSTHSDHKIISEIFLHI